MDNNEFKIYESEIFYTYSSYLDVKNIDFKILIEKFLKFKIAGCIVEDNKIHYYFNNKDVILGFEVQAKNKNSSTLNFYPIKNIETGEDVPEKCLYSALDGFNHYRLFNRKESLNFIKVYLEKIFIERHGEIISLMPNITIFEDGVIIFKYKSEITGVELNLDEYIGEHVNLGLSFLDSVYVNPFIYELLVKSYNYVVQTSFYERFKLLKDERFYSKEVENSTLTFDLNEEKINLIELTRDEFSKDTLSSLTQSFLNMIAYLLSNPNSGIKYLVLGQKKIIENGNYWEGRPYIYLLDFEGQCLTATENNVKFSKEFASILERFSSDLRKKFNFGEDIRLFDDASVFFEKSACLKVLSKKSKEVESYENYILSHEAITTYIEYAYILNRALLQKITQSHSVDDISALRWKVNALTSPNEIASSGEVRIYSNDAWGKFGIENLKAQISDAIQISYDDKQFKHEKKGNLINLVFAILFGLLAIPSVGKDVISPIWKMYNFYYPSNSYENLYFFLVTLSIFVILAFIVFLVILIFSKKV